MNSAEALTLHFIGKFGRHQIDIFLSSEYKKASTFHVVFIDCVGVLHVIVGHFVLSPWEREKRDRRDSRGDERGREERRTGMKVKKQKK